MHSSGTGSRTTGLWKISGAKLRFGSTKLAALIIRGALTLAVFAVLMLIAAQPAQGQETVLYNFTGGIDGAYPLSNLTFDGAGNLYGTASGGGAWGAGTVFELSPNGNGGWDETVLYSFTGGADGSSPEGPVTFDSVGNLYGTTHSGGANGYGVVFELSPEGSSWTETVLYTFTGGYSVDPGLIFDPVGNLYGAAVGGVFELSPSGGGWTEQQIYTASYVVGLTMDAAGNIFGVSGYNVFELSPNGSGGWSSTVLHTWAGGPKDGSDPQGAPVLDQAGNLYGTTKAGGAKYWGTVYMLSPITTGKKKGQWKERRLYSFSDNSRGGAPMAGLLLDFPSIWLTTMIGGYHQAGTIFVLQGEGFKEKADVWRFNWFDGAQPQGSLILDSENNLYGTVTYGGSGYVNGGSLGYGVVSEFTP